MKEKNLIEMKNKIEAMTRVLQQLMNELNYMRELSIGTLETVKLLPGYDEAIEQLKLNVIEKNKEEKKEEKKLEV
jgi:beta-phosphoglucomutase-like phosphatase (HAD superfamily)